MKRLPLFFLLFIFCFITLLFGCGPSLLTPTPMPTSTALPTLLPTCVPSPGNFYSSNEGTNKQATLLADKIYGELFIGALGKNNQAGINDAQNQALQFFTYEVRRWTRFSDEVSFADGSKARIFVTFISPQLVRAAALAHAMLGDIEGHNLNSYTGKGLQRLDQRNEYLFLVTVHIEAIPNSAETFVLPAELFALKGTSGAPIRHFRHDHFLDIPIPLSKGSIAGFVFFPLTQAMADKCSRVLDEERDSYIMFLMNNVQAGKQKINLAFEIPFISPALLDNEIIPTPIPNAAIAPQDFEPSEGLPLLSTLSDAPNDFWRGFTRFVWKKFTFDGMVSD